MLQDLFNKFSNESVELHSPVLKRDLVSPAHTTKDDVPLRVLRKNIKIEKEEL